jgi:hypothetical protein
MEIDRFCKQCRHRSWFFGKCKKFDVPCEKARDDESVCGNYGHHFEVNCHFCSYSFWGMCSKFLTPEGFSMKCKDARASEDLCGKPGKSFRFFHY